MSSSGNRAWLAIVLACGMATSSSSCLLIESFSITETAGSGGATGSTTTDATTSTLSSTSTESTSSTSSAGGAGGSGGSSTSSSGSGGGCSCTGLVSAYRFSDAANLGKDFVGNNDFPNVTGSPMQSTVTPNGLPGHSISLDGTSSVCGDLGLTFGSAEDHTLCWWSRPASLGNSTNQFAQTCGYDTWTQNAGVDYLWRINNCNGGTAIDLVVPSVYAAGQWVQICQTYEAASMTREVTIDGDTGQKTTLVDGSPILEPTNQAWCIGSYDGGGYWNGLIYLPLWFDRVLDDAEIQNVSANACCLQ